MQKFVVFLVCSFCLVFFVPDTAVAAGLVPCGGIGQSSCQTCDVVKLTNNVVEWLVIVLGTFAAIIIIYAGIKLVTSGGNQSSMESAKSMITNVIIGYVIILAAWLAIDYAMKALIDEGTFGVWNEVQCSTTDTPTLSPQEEINFASPLTASGANRTQFTTTQLSGSVASIAAAGDVRSQAEAAARAAGITDPQQIKTYVALISQESSMCRNRQGPETPYGRAYGCGQMLLSTARAYDSAVTVDRLRDDNAYNLSLSARYYADQMRRYNGNIQLTLASYNGGDKANSNSSVCPGQLAWQCQQNGGYQQTRNYVSNITRVAAGL